MSTTMTPSRPRATSVVNHPVTVRRAISSEWIKFRSLRSTFAVLGAAMASMVILALVIAFNTRRITPKLQLDDHVQSSTLQGFLLAQLLVGALGVLFSSGEYSTGMIRSTLVAVPKRLPVLWAKLVVFVTVTAVSMTLISVLSFLAAQALIGQYRTGYSLGDPGVLRVVVGTGVYLTLVGVLGLCLGWILRSTPGALVTHAGLLLILGLVLGFLGSWGKNVAQFLPGNAGEAFIRTLPHTPALTPWTGLGVLCLWVVGAIAVAAVQLHRHDA